MVSTLTLPWEGPGSNPWWDLSFWSLNVNVWIFSRHSGFFPQFKSMLHRFIVESKSPLGVHVSLKWLYCTKKLTYSQKAWTLRLCSFFCHFRMWQEEISLNSRLWSDLESCGKMRRYGIIFTWLGTDLELDESYSISQCHTPQQVTQGKPKKCEISLFLFSQK